MKRRVPLGAALFLIATLAACSGSASEPAAEDPATAAAPEATSAAESEDAPSEPATDDASEGSSEATSETPSETGSEAAAGPAGDGQLAFGTVLPQTGSAAYLGAPTGAGVRLAVQEVNEAGGVLGADIELLEGDSGDLTTNTADQTVGRLSAAGVDVVIGSVSSAVTLSILDQVTGGGTVLMSPVSTADELSEVEDDGLFFRTVPPDTLQGQVLGELIVGDGAATVGILAVQDPYGEGLLEEARTQIEASGGTVAVAEIYDPAAPAFDAEVQALAAQDLDAIALIGFDEVARILTTMIEQGIGPADIAVYGTDASMSSALPEQVSAEDPGVLDGVRGTTTLSELSDDFRERLLAVEPGLSDFTFSAESYDAAAVLALAAAVAGTDDSRAIAEEIVGVTRDGEPCDTVAACLERVAAGEDIDYEGVSGALTFDDRGQPTTGSYGIVEFDADGELQVAEYVTAELGASS